MPSRTVTARVSPSGLYMLDHAPAGKGPGSPTILLVHGSMDRSTSFARVVARLPEFRVITYDRRGYRRSRTSSSAGAGAAGLEGHVEDLVKILDEGVGDGVVLAGHSYGGTLAIATALRIPEGVASLFVFEPPLPWLDPSYRSSPRAPASGNPAQAAEAFMRRMIGDERWERLPQRVKDLRRAEGPALVAETGDLRRSEPPFDVSGLRAPLTVGRGGLSSRRHRAAAAALAEAVPDAELVEIPAAAHGAHLSEPAAFAGLVRAAAGRSRSGG